MRRRIDLAGPGRTPTLVKTALVLGLLFSLIAPEALSQPLIYAASNATLPATLLSLALLAMGLEKQK